MGKLYKEQYGHHPGRHLRFAVAEALDGEDYDRGALEEAQATADNCAEAIGRLVEILHGRGILTLDDAGKIAGTPIIEVEDTRDTPEMIPGTLLPVEK